MDGTPDASVLGVRIWRSLEDVAAASVARSSLSATSTGSTWAIATSSAGPASWPTRTG